MAISLVLTQIFAAIFLLVATVACGICPAWIGHHLTSRRRRKACDNSHSCLQLPESPDDDSEAARVAGQKILSFLMNFGGGVLFATSILHMLPEVRESFEAAVSNSTAGQPAFGSGFVLPLTESLVCAGFFLIYLAEELAHLLLSHAHGSGDGTHGQMHSHSHLISYKQPERKEEHDFLREEPTCHSYGAVDGREGETTSSLGIDTVSRSLPHSLSSGGMVQSLPMFRCIMIVFALSFHSIFDGLAIGLQDTATHTMQLLFAITVHKLVIAFVVGLDVYSETDSMRKVIAYMLPFSVMSPIGVVAAAFAKVNMPDSAVGILSALSAGSLLYIAFFEILFREKSQSKLLGCVQFLAVLSGFLLMAGLQAVTEH